MWKAGFLVLLAAMLCERTCFANRNVSKHFLEEAHWREALRKEALRNEALYKVALRKEALGNEAVLKKASLKQVIWKKFKSMEFFRKYQRFNKINDYIKILARENPSIAKVFSIGKTVEGRKLNVIKIGSMLSKSKPAIWIDGGIHAREWISPATVVFIVYKLILEYKNQKDLMDNFHWYILPVVNPDGYEYSHKSDRMWRKNRNPNNKTCPGVDLNRNWKYHWRESGTSTNVCDEIYAGRAPFSEPETKAISNFIRKKRKRQKFIAFLTFHSFGQEWLIPWGWTKTLPSDYKELVRVAKKAVGALAKVRGTTYKIRPSNKIAGPASGGSDDWAKGVAGIKYSYTVELPDEGLYGFDLPEKLIIIIGKEMWEAVKAFGRAIMEKNRKNFIRKKSL